MLSVSFSLPRLTDCISFIWSACNVTLTRLIVNLRRVTAEAEELDSHVEAEELESHVEDIYIDCPRWPVSPGSRASESYELQSKGF